MWAGPVASRYTTDDCNAGRLKSEDIRRRERLCSLDPRRQTVDVHRPGQPIRTLGMDDMLEGEDVVPGWSMAVRELFDQG